MGDPAIALPLYVHGPSGCGKSAVVRSVLQTLGAPAAYLDCISMPTPQALFDAALNQLAGWRPSSANGYTSWATCDSVAGFIAAVHKLVPNALEARVRRTVCERGGKHGSYS